MKALIALLLFSAAAAYDCAQGDGTCDANKMGDSMLQSETLVAKGKLARDEVPGSDEDDEAEISNLSLLLGSEQESPSTASILAMVQSMAEQDARGKLHSVNVTESIIQKIIQQMEEKVITAADTQHKQDQSEVNRMLEDIKKCKKTMENKFNAPSNGVNALKQSTDRAKISLTTCKTDLVGKITTKETECTAFTSFVKGLSNSKPKCVCSLAETPSPEVLQCIQEAKSWGTSSEASYIDLRDKCDTATGAVATKEEACNTAQRTFESSFCSYGEKLTDTCQDYEKCHSDKSAEYSDSNKQIKVAETSRKAEFVAAKKVICFVGVLKAMAAEKSKDLKSCIDKTYSTSHLDMSYPASPPEATCDISPVANKPCDEAFISTHYGASWSTKAPAATCVPCAWSKETSPPPSSTPPAPGTDLGYNHPVTCSSGCRSFYGEAELASNGVIDETHGAHKESGGLAHTHNEQDAWVEVDFEKEFRMGKVTLWNGWQWGCCLGRINPFRLVFFDASRNEVSRVTGKQAKTHGDGETPVTLDSPVVARFVRVQLDNHANYLHIAELRAYAA